MTTTQYTGPATQLTETEPFLRALQLAEQHAEEVDTVGRFPEEAVQALRASGALAWYVPVELGGFGVSISTLAEATLDLSRRCAATGMIFAMHQIQVAAIVHHRANSIWLDAYLRRMTEGGRLIASATSEAGIGGNLRQSIAAIEPFPDSAGALVRFEKEATTISYGAQADDLLTTVRRSKEAEPGDQVLVLTDLFETERHQISDWDTLGMRGTCSPGFRINAVCSPEQILPAPFGTIAAETMVPFSHILWAHVWLGSASSAFERAHKFVRAQALQKPGTTPPAAVHLSELAVCLAEFRALAQAVTSEYDAIIAGSDWSVLSTVGYAIRINTLKIAASEAAVKICEGALRICGFQGYKNGGPYSVGRQLRDAQSAALMIANDRVHTTNAALWLVHRDGK